MVGKNCITLSPETMNEALQEYLAARYKVDGRVLKILKIYDAPASQHGSPYQLAGHTALGVPGPAYNVEIEMVAKEPQ
jgi:hypothetical protein